MTKKFYTSLQLTVLLLPVDFDVRIVLKRFNDCRCWPPDNILLRKTDVYTIRVHGAQITRTQVNCKREVKNSLDEFLYVLRITNWLNFNSVMSTLYCYHVDVWYIEHFILLNFF